MAYVTGYSAKKARLLLKNLNKKNAWNDTNITDAIKTLIASLNKNRDIAYDVYQVEDMRSIKIQNGISKLSLIEDVRSIKINNSALIIIE